MLTHEPRKETEFIPQASGSRHAWSKEKAALPSAIQDHDSPCNNSDMEIVNRSARTAPSSAMPRGESRLTGHPSALLDSQLDKESAVVAEGVREADEWIRTAWRDAAAQTATMKYAQSASEWKKRCIASVSNGTAATARAILSGSYGEQLPYGQSPSDINMDASAATVVHPVARATPEWKREPGASNMRFKDEASSKPSEG